jgi:hypothetical protein
MRVTFGTGDSTHRFLGFARAPTGRLLAMENRCVVNCDRLVAARAAV